MTDCFHMKGAIFDLDGTLFDSMSIWEQIDIRFLEKRGFHATTDYVQAVTPMGFHEAAEYTISRFGLQESISEVISEWKAMVKDAYAHTIQLKPHAENYLNLLTSRNIKLGIATALTPDLYIPALKNNGIDQLFSSHANLAEVQHGKGYPDIYLLCAKRLELSPSDCIVFEDITDGIQGAKKGGFQACGVYDPYSSHEWNKIQSLADYSLSDFQELL